MTEYRATEYGHSILHETPNIIPMLQLLTIVAIIWVVDAKVFGSDMVDANKAMEVGECYGK